MTVRKVATHTAVPITPVLPPQTIQEARDLLAKTLGEKIVGAITLSSKMLFERTKKPGVIQAKGFITVADICDERELSLKATIDLNTGKVTYRTKTEYTDRDEMMARTT